MPLVNDTVGGRGGRGRGRGKGSVSNGISRSGRSKNKGGNPADNAFIFENIRLSTQENKDPSYIEKGIAHTSESVAINIVRGTVTDVFNLVGIN